MQSAVLTATALCYAALLGEVQLPGNYVCAK